MVFLPLDSDVFYRKNVQSLAFSHSSLKFFFFCLPKIFFSKHGNEKSFRFQFSFFFSVFDVGKNKNDLTLLLVYDALFVSSYNNNNLLIKICATENNLVRRIIIEMLKVNLS